MAKSKGGELASAMGAAQMSKAQVAREAEFQAEDDLRTLSRAHEIGQDGKRLRHARRFHRRQTKALSSQGKALFGGKR